MPSVEDQSMDRSIAARPILRAVAAGTIMLAIASGALAQSTTAPDLRTRTVPPSTTAKALPAARMKSCSLYGDGFVYVPGTDSCIKIGGYVTLEGSRGR
jgi:hypothetical protein